MLKKITAAVLAATLWVAPQAKSTPHEDTDITKPYSIAAQKIWQRDFKQPVRWIVSDTSGLALVGSDYSRRMEAYEVAQGGLVWKRHFPAALWSPPLIRGSLFFVSPFNQTIVGRNLENGRYVFSLLDYRPTSSSHSKLNSPPPICKASPIAYGDNILTLSVDGILTITDVNGKIIKRTPLIWNKLNKTQFWGTPVVNNNILYAHSLNGELWRTDLNKTGYAEGWTLNSFNPPEKKNKSSFNTEFRSNTIIAGSLLLNMSMDGTIYAHTFVQGKPHLRWVRLTDPQRKYQANSQDWPLTQLVLSSKKTANDDESNLDNQSKDTDGYLDSTSQPFLSYQKESQKNAQASPSQWSVKKELGFAPKRSENYQEEIQALSQSDKSKRDEDSINQSENEPENLIETNVDNEDDGKDALDNADNNTKDNTDKNLDKNLDKDSNKELNNKDSDTEKNTQKSPDEKIKTSAAPRSDISSIITDKTAVYASCKKMVLAVNSQTGHSIWKCDLPQGLAWPVATWRDYLIAFCEDKTAVFIHCQSGKIISTIQLPDLPSCPPNVCKNNLLVGYSDGKVDSFALKDNSLPNQDQNEKVNEVENKNKMSKLPKKLF